MVGRRLIFILFALSYSPVGWARSWSCQDVQVSVALGSLISTGGADFGFYNQAMDAIRLKSRLDDFEEMELEPLSHGVRFKPESLQNLERGDRIFVSVARHPVDRMRIFAEKKDSLPFVAGAKDGGSELEQFRGGAALEFLSSDEGPPQGVVMAMDVFGSFHRTTKESFFGRAGPDWMSTLYILKDVTPEQAQDWLFPIQAHGARVLTAKRESAATARAFRWTAASAIGFGALTLLGLGFYLEEQIYHAATAALQARLVEEGCPP